MKIKKIAAAIAAAAMAVSMVAVNAFATTVTLNSEYSGAWSLSKGIPMSEFEAIGGDVKIVYDIVVKEPLVGEHNHLARPMNVDWTQLEGCKGYSVIAKADGFIAIADTQTKLEIVVPEATWKGLKGYAEDNSDAAFCLQISDVYVTSAELSPADGTEQDFMIIEEEEARKVFDGTLTYGSAPAANDAPASDAAPTTSAGTGNVPAAVMVSVMAVAGAAAVASKKRK